jgi:hypothetical protein
MRHKEGSEKKTLESSSDKVHKNEGCRRESCQGGDVAITARQMQALAGMT